MKKRLKLLIFPLLILIVLSYIYWEQPINKEYECIILDRRGDKIGNIKVAIGGIMKLSLLRKNIACLNIKIGDKHIPDLQNHQNIYPINYKGITARRVAGKVKICFEGSDRLEQYVYKSFKGNSKCINLEYSYFDKEKFGTEYIELGKLYFDSNFNNTCIFVDKDQYISGMKLSKNTVIVSENSAIESAELVKRMVGYIFE